MRNNRGGIGSVLTTHSENWVQEGNVGLSCCVDATKCGVGAQARVADQPFVAEKPFGFLQNVVWRGNENINVCPPLPTGPE